MANTQNTILLRGPFGRKNEAVALAANIKPGMLIEFNSASKLIPHGTADGFGGMMVAVEDVPNQGKGIGDVCAAGDNIPFYHVASGAKILLLLKKGANFPAGTKLASSGVGTFQAAGAGTKQVFATVAAGAGIDLTAAATDTLVACDVV